jgi:hypothetical protein
MKERQRRSVFVPARDDKSLAFTRRHAKLLVRHRPVFKNLEVALANHALALGRLVDALHLSDSRTTLINLK